MAKLQKQGPKRIISLLLPPLISAESNDSHNAGEENKKLRAAAYCRVSTGSEEQRTSYVAQVDYYTRYLSGHSEYMNCGIYADEGVSGTSIKRRPAFQRMMNDCRDGKLDLIITKSVSRFGRNTLDCLVCIRELKALHVDVYFEKENIHTLHNEGEILLSLISAVSQAESETLSSNITWGIRRKYEKGHVQSIPCGKFLGYDKDADGNLTINEEQAVIVRRIYQEFLEGNSYYAIANKLTAEAVPTEQNKRAWNWSTVKQMLTNEKYMGDTKCQKTYNADPLTKRRVQNTGEFPQFYFENTHPAIIDRETWHCVQLEFQRQAQIAKMHGIKTYRTGNAQYPFSGRVICKYCGRSYGYIRDETGSHMRCQSYKGNRGVQIPDLDRGTENDLDHDRPTLCTDIRIPSELPKSRFVQEWNRLVDEKDWRQKTNTDDILRNYRLRELIHMTDDIGYIEGFAYEVMIKTLDHIEVSIDNSEIVFFPWASIQDIQDR